MKPITAALIGAGQRGAGAYAPYAWNHPEEIRFVAVADGDQERRERFAETYGIPETETFAGWEELLARPKLADAVLICTQDKLHFEPTIKALEMGYHVLLEKPMSPDPLECFMIGEYAEKFGLVLSICHVLRYTDFFAQIKQIVSDGTIGSLVSIVHVENVEHRHQAHSFVRGNWSKSEVSCPMILAKSCHDMDILQWIVDEPCTKVSSFGSLMHFRKESAPDGAPKRCLDGCPVQETCPYYAPRMYMERDDWVGAVLRSVVSNDTSDEGVLNSLKDGPYGRCVYHCDNDVVDHQVVNLEFASGATASFTMSAFTHEGGRSVKLMGTLGQIRADMEKNVIEVTSFKTRETKTVHLETDAAGHGGGDTNIMRDFVRLVRSDGKEKGLTGAKTSVQSHLIAFAAEKSRVEGETILMQKYVDELQAEMQKRGAET
ncbi:oxidoreductase family protein [Paenibacillus taihuensis]|uniref:Oxidoreductase family protein n=1 Tax=Paenibacillus taihuensis TaxID=1156355 RepID=A0A3D9SCB5_9BACL|nr:Gfo/Idh/MocA family oxidoreductase [Paenibacillus taihuensis]REE87421.1 oxidoreductase family protein [Paenibacillus taihuensis]